MDSMILFYPVTVTAHNYLAEWRNAGGVPRKAIAAVGYAVLSVAALVEAVAKAALTILFAGGCFGIGCVGLFIPRLMETALACFEFAYASYLGTFNAFDSSLSMVGALFQNLFFQKIEKITVRLP